MPRPAHQVFHTFVVELILKPLIFLFLFGFVLLIIGYSISWILLSPSSGSKVKEVVRDFSEFLKLHRLKDSKDVFSQHGKSRSL